MTYQQVVDDPGSDIQLICTKAYKGTYQVGPGMFVPYDYKMGDVLPRNCILLKKKNWKIKK